MSCEVCGDPMHKGDPWDPGDEEDEGMPYAKRTNRGSGGTRKMTTPPQRPRAAGGLTAGAALGAPGAMPRGMRRLPPQLPTNLTAMGAFGGAMPPGAFGLGNMTGLGGGMARRRPGRAPGGMLPGQERGVF